MNQLLKIVGLAMAILLVAGCSAGSQESSKAGGSPLPVVLQIGTDDPPGRPGADQIEEFARRVEEATDGTLTIEPVWQAAGTGVDDWDQVVARMVVSGDLDMAMIPARAWDTEGVTTLRALHAPLLITTNEHLHQVVTSDLVDDMLAGLSDVGIKGLALLPEGIRHLFLFGDPPPSLSDLAGKVVRAPRSETTYAFFTALGATPDDLGGDDGRYDQGVADGSIIGVESSYALAGTFPGGTTAVANVGLFPKVNSLVINARVFEGLSGEHQDALTTAARETASWAVSMLASEAEAAAEYCRNGGRIIIDDSQTGQIVSTAEVVNSTLEEDPATAGLMVEIRALAATAASDSGVAPCEAESDSDPVAVATGPFPEGVYRTEVTLESLIEAGADQPTAFNHAGLWTLTFADGVLTVEDVNAASGNGATDTGVYCIEGGRVDLGIGIDVPEPTCGDFWSAAWEVEGDELRFVDVRSGHGFETLIDALFQRSWTKIG
ncbi:MAG TPA: TRAP transporter substrate-binding protein DctP [Acidimicrobiia bacterium]|nr:TRAP transporter substrate-binding protein DctP [Acidimicrobiia bacterium]